MRAATLLFCVGATKSGTSWLHDYLSSHPECHLRSVKELHYFDTLEKGRLDSQIAVITQQRDAMAERLQTAPSARLPDLGQRIRDREDWLGVLGQGGESPRAYLDYLRDGRGAAQVVGDVTPAYALLPEARLRAMAALLPDVRFLYLMRDPVARLWSHVRMIAARRGPDGKADPRRARNILIRTLQGDEPEIAIRGDYAAAMAKLTGTVTQDRLLCLFYEDLFGGDGIAQICRFLGIAPMAGDTARRVHAGAALDMPDILRDKATAWLAPQYDFVARTLGRLPEQWQANMVRV